MEFSLNIAVAGRPAFPHPADVVKDITYNDLADARVLFINMPLRESARPVDAPEGPLLMATNLRVNYGVDDAVIDLNAYRIEDGDGQRRGLVNGRHLTEAETRNLIKRHLERFGEPLMIGLSGKITTLRWQERVARIVREFLPDVFLVSGGGLATELKAGLFTYIPELDGICHSEGDDVILKIVYDAKLIHEHGLDTALASGKLAPYHMGTVNGRHRFLYLGNRPRNLDKLPFADMDILAEDAYGNPVRDWYLQTPVWGIKQSNSSATPWDDAQVTPKTNSVSSRGCPFGCSYCFRGANGERNWTIRSADHIYGELVHNQARYGIRFHGFHDDNFAVNAARIKDMVPLLGELNIWWGTHTRLDEIADINPVTKQPAKELRVELMAKAGCKYIGFGPESANPKVLSTIGKGGHTLTNGMIEVLVDGKPYQFPRSMVEGIRNSLRVGIHSNCTWIVGSPTETLDDAKDTVRFILWQTEEYDRYGVSADAVNKNMFTMTWYPGVTMVNEDKVREMLSRVFKLTFVPAGPNSAGVAWQPVIDDHFHKYLIELDDATKVLHDPDTGEALHFSEMTLDQFLQVREYIDSGQLFKILDM